MAYSHHSALSPFSNCRPDLFGPSRAQSARHNSTNEYPPATGHSKRHSWQKLTKAFTRSKSKDKFIHDTELQVHAGPDNPDDGFIRPEQYISNLWKAMAAPSIQLQSDSATNLPWEQPRECGNDACIYDESSFKPTSAEDDFTLSPPSDQLVRQLSNTLRNSLQLTTTGTNTSCDYLSPVVSETASLNNQLGTSSPINKRSRRKDFDESHSDDDERCVKRSRQHSPDPNYTPPQDCVLFACPFSKFNPDKYSHKNVKESDREYRNCSTGYWPTIARLKQHIYRTHDRVEKCCQRCWQSFTNEQLLRKHSATADCEVRPCPAGSLTRQQRHSIKERAQCDPVQQWYKIWDILFPDHLRPHSVSPEWVTGRDVLRVFQIMRERLPGLLSAKNGHERQHIEEAIDLICDDFSRSNDFVDFLSSSYVIEALAKTPTNLAHDSRHAPGIVHAQHGISIEGHGSHDVHAHWPVNAMFSTHQPITISPQPQHIIPDTEFGSFPFPNFDMSMPHSQVYADQYQH